MLSLGMKMMRCNVRRVLYDMFGRTKDGLGIDWENNFKDGDEFGMISSKKLERMRELSALDVDLK